MAVKRSLFHRLFPKNSFTIALWGVLIIAILTAGCRIQLPGRAIPTAAARNSFRARSESEDGAVVSWSGYKDGYQPGENASFEITILNQTENTWQGRLCLNLLSGDSAAVLNTLLEREIDLPPGAGFADTVSVQLPGSLQPGPYGLSLVVRRPAGPMVELTTIQVGETQETRQPPTSLDTQASLDACPPEDPENQLVEMAREDLADKLDLDVEEIEVLSVEPEDFPDASLGVPEAGKDYIQVITPGYVIELSADAERYRYHAGNGRVVFVPKDRYLTEAPDTARLKRPAQGASITLPVHLLAFPDNPGQQLEAFLLWEDGTTLREEFTILEFTGNQGVLIGSMDWKTESLPPQPETPQAELILKDAEGNVLGQRSLTVFSGDHPETRLVDLYWLLGEKLESEQRRVLKQSGIEKAALEELLWGPPPRNLAGFQTALPTPEEVLSYPGRQEDWGVRVELLDLIIADGLATVNFSQEMRAYGGGSARVGAIREQITRTLTQFPTIEEVEIAVEGEVEGVLQP